MSGITAEETSTLASRILVTLASSGGYVGYTCGDEMLMLNFALCCTALERFLFPSCLMTVDHEA